MAYVYEITPAVTLYGYGATALEAASNARRQVQGASQSMANHMLSRMRVREISDEDASEIEEMLAADVIAWTDVTR